MQTLAEWLKTQDKYNDPAVGIVEEAIKTIPEFNVLDFRAIKGTKYKIYRRDTLPKGAFREIGKGVAPSSSTGSQVEVNCYFYDALITADEAMIDGDEEILGDTMANEGIALFGGCTFDMASQIYYGAANSVGGFPGFNDFITDAMTLKAVNTTSSPFSSVYFVHTGLQGIQFIAGKNSVLTLGEIYKEDVDDGTGQGKSYRAHKQRMKGWYGLQNASTKCVGKITHLSKSNALSQQMMAEMLGKFPARAMPNAIFMNRDTYFNQWLPEKAKVGILKSGSTKLEIASDYNFLQAVDNFMGVKIYITDAIKEDETPPASSGSNSSDPE